MAFPIMTVENRVPQEDRVEMVELTIVDRLKYLLIGIAFLLGGSWFLFTDISQSSGRFAIFWTIPYFETILGLFCIGLSFGGLYPFVTGRVKEDAYEYMI